MNYILLFVVGILTVIAEVAEGKGFLFIEFVEYNNARGLGSNGHCCDGRWKVCHSQCDHYFEICLTETGGIRGDHTGCLVTDPIKNKNTIVFGDAVGDLHNPVKIVRHDLVKDYDLRIKISDYDKFSKDDYVDTLRTHIHFNYSSIISEPILLSGRTQLLLIVWYECDEGFYDCESCEGQGLCNRHCVVPARGNGFCDFYGNLVCYQGWTGDDCSVEMTTPPTNSSGYLLRRYVARDFNKI